MCSSVGRSSSSITHALVTAGGLLELARLAVDLAADQQPQVVALRARERLDDLGERLALAHEAAGHDEANEVVGGAVDVGLRRQRDELRVTAPGEQRALDPEAAVALLLGAGERSR